MDRFKVLSALRNNTTTSQGAISLHNNPLNQQQQLLNSNKNQQINQKNQQNQQKQQQLLYENETYSNRIDLIEASKRIGTIPCNPTYLATCPGGKEMYPYVRFWRRFFHKEDCYRSPLFEPANADGK